MPAVLKTSKLFPKKPSPVIEFTSIPDFAIPSESLTFATRFKKLFIKPTQGMQNYELMVIFTPVLSDDDYKASQKKFSAFVKENAGEVLHTNAWGLKSLAFPINKKTTGLYWVLEYTAPSDFNEKLKIQLLRDDNVMRHMFTALDKYAVEYNGKKRSGVPTGIEKVEV